MSSTSVHKSYTPRNRIADGARRYGGPNLETIMARVKAGIAELEQEYLGEAHAELSELSACLNVAKTASGEARSQAIDRIFRISHDLRGMAASFDYPLVTRIGTSLCRLIDQTGLVGPLELAVIDLHVGAMKMITSNKITGESDAKALELIEGIDVMVNKYIENPVDR